MKVCQDCGSSSPDGAVRCVDCGSLFVDQLGIDVGKRRDDDTLPVGTPVTFGVTETTGSLQTGNVSVCKVCRAVGSPNQKRCTVCGSDQLVLRSAAAAAKVGRRRKWLSAWDRRPKEGVIDADFADVQNWFIYACFGIGVMKLLVCTALGAYIMFAPSTGLGGLHPYTVYWRYPLSIVLLADAFLAAFGAWGLYRLNKYGPLLLAVSFLFDVVLLGWIVYCDAYGTLNLWPGAGPYLLLLCVCLLLSLEMIYKARKGQLQ